MENDLNQKKNRIQKECLRGQPAFCSAACPFDLDVPGFVAKIEKGSFTAAYRQYRDAVAFPEVVSRLCEAPCIGVCPGNVRDASVCLPGLERAAVAYTGRKEPDKYNVPEKKRRVAVVGAGGCGLACALRFASHHYQVTVYEKEAAVGGIFAELLSPDIYLKDIERSFSNTVYELRLGTEVRSLDEIDADAVLIATGAGGPVFGYAPGRGVTPTEKPGVFLGGALCGRNAVDAVADGLQAFKCIEQYLKTGLMPPPSEKKKTTTLRIDPSYAVPLPKITPVADAYTQQEASAEAGRCLKCACASCLLHCDMMAYSGKMPPRIAEDTYCTVYPMSLFGGDTFAKRLMGTCNMCGACRDFCPEGLDTGDLILEARRDIQRKKKWSWAYHEFWLKDMKHASSDRAGLRRFAPGEKDCEVVFFPGCQLGASLPDYVLKSYEWLLSKNPGVALWLDCCGAPALWSGIEEEISAAEKLLREGWETLDRPEIIAACPTCKKMFKRFLPDAVVYSLIERMAEEGFEPHKKISGVEYAVFDPCAARFEEGLFAAVRKLAEKAGARLAELPENRNESRCCSNGGHVAVADPDYAEYQVSSRIAQSPLPYLAYCANCRDIFAKAGKESLHLLDVLFDLGGKERPAPRLSDRQRNREILKVEALRRFWKEETELPVWKSEKLLISDEIRDQMSADHVTAENVWEVIDFCERNERTVLMPDTGEKCGFHMIGNATIWVAYKEETDGIYVTKVYPHRMRFVIEETWNGQRVNTDL